MKNIVFDSQAFHDFQNWINVDKKIYKKIIDLINDIQRVPFLGGIGKPEPLKHELKGYWSRRINDKHRLVYSVDEKSIYILSCKTHYGQ